MQCRLELRLFADPASHEPAGVERNDDRLIALDLVLARREFISSRGRGPGDMTKLVTADIIPHRFELTPLATPYRTPLDSEERSCAERLEFHLASSPHIRIDLYTLFLSYRCLAPNEAEAR